MFSTAVSIFGRYFPEVKHISRVGAKGTKNTLCQLQGISSPENVDTVSSKAPRKHIFASSRVQWPPLERRSKNELFRGSDLSLTLWLLNLIQPALSCTFHFSVATVTTRLLGYTIKVNKLSDRFSLELETRRYRNCNINRIIQDSMQR